MNVVLGGGRSPHAVVVLVVVDPCNAAGRYIEGGGPWIQTAPASRIAAPPIAFCKGKDHVGLDGEVCAYASDDRVRMTGSEFEGGWHLCHRHCQRRLNHVGPIPMWTCVGSYRVCSSMSIRRILFVGSSIGS